MRRVVFKLSGKMGFSWSSTPEGLYFCAEPSAANEISCSLNDACFSGERPGELVASLQRRVHGCYALAYVSSTTLNLGCDIVASIPLFIV